MLKSILSAFTPDPVKLRERMLRETELALIVAEAQRDAIIARCDQLEATRVRLNEQCKPCVVVTGQRMTITPEAIDALHARAQFNAECG